jgi:hypothetical protein
MADHTTHRKMTPMPQIIIAKKTQLLSAAIALSAAGFLTSAPPAQAAPPLPLAPACDRYTFKDGVLRIYGPNGYDIEIPRNASDPDPDGDGDGGCRCLQRQE